MSYGLISYQMPKIGHSLNVKPFEYKEKMGKDWVVNSDYAPYEHYVTTPRPEENVYHSLLQKGHEYVTPFDITADGQFKCKNGGMYDLKEVLQSGSNNMNTILGFVNKSAPYAYNTVSIDQMTALLGQATSNQSQLMDVDGNNKIDQHELLAFSIYQEIAGANPNDSLDGKVTTRERNTASQFMNNKNNAQTVKTELANLVNTIKAVLTS